MAWTKAIKKGKAAVKAGAIKALNARTALALVNSNNNATTAAARAAFYLANRKAAVLTRGHNAAKHAAKYAGIYANRALAANTKASAKYTLAVQATSKSRAAAVLAHS